MSVRLIQATFSQGELSPKLHSRLDLEHFRKGLKRCENFVLMRHGGLRKRSGTRFLSLARNQHAPARLVPFEFSTEQSYALEWSAGHVRFFSEQAQVQKDGAAYELAHPFSQSELWQFDFTQSADVMTIAHGDHAPHELRRLGETNWERAAITFKDAPAEWAEDNWPEKVTYYMERLTWARTKSHPQDIWHSKAGGLHDHGKSEPLQADDAMHLSILSGRVNAVQFIAEDDDLLIGTTSAARTIGPSNRNSVFSAANSRQRLQTSMGAADIQPAQIGNALLYVGRYGKNIREYIYDAGQGRYIAPDLTIVNEHIFFSGIAELAYQQDPDSVVWARMKDGSLAGITYERDQQILGVSRFSLGGAGFVEAITTKPGEGQDELWLLVRRMINGQTVRTIEVLTEQFEEQSIEDGFFVDCGLSYSGVPVSSVSGLDHLEGASVAVLADGAVMPPLVVENGTVSLPEGLSASKIHVGLGYEAGFETLPIVDGMPDGTAFGAVKRIASLWVDLLRTASLQIAIGGDSRRDDAAWHDMLPLTGDALHQQATEERTGIVNAPGTGGWDKVGTLRVRSTAPLPATILSLTLTMES